MDLAGLPPKRLPEYYARHDLARLAQRWIFGDWPGVPGIASNARAVAGLLPDDVASAAVGGNALRVYCRAGQP